MSEIRKPNTVGQASEIKVERFPLIRGFAAPSAAGSRSERTQSPVSRDCTLGA